MILKTFEELKIFITIIRYEEGLRDYSEPDNLEVIIKYAQSTFWII